jgi:cell division protein FtsB
MAQRKARISFGKELYYILCSVVVIVSTIFSIWGPGGFREMRKAQQELEVHRARVNALQRSNSERLQRIQDLKSNPDFLEEYAREKEYAREGEIIQRLHTPPPAPSPKKSPQPKP